MADVDNLFSEFVTEHRAGGEADPLAFLDQVQGAERAELATLIDGYLVRSPGQAWDAEAFEGSPSALWAEEMSRSLEGAAGTWPVLLPSLRERARIKRSELVERLADRLGVGGGRDLVGSYYHRMEQGQLASDGVSTRVLTALAEIVGSTAEALREAGRGIDPGEEASGGAVFARSAAPDPEWIASAAQEDLLEPPQSPGASQPENQPDAAASEVDRLFTGGD